MPMDIRNFFQPKKKSATATTKAKAAATTHAAASPRKRTRRRVDEETSKTSMSNKSSAANNKSDNSNINNINNKSNSSSKKSRSKKKLVIVDSDEEEDLPKVAPAKSPEIVLLDDNDDDDDDYHDDNDNSDKETVATSPKTRSSKSNNNTGKRPKRKQPPTLSPPPLKVQVSTSSPDTSTLRVNPPTAARPLHLASTPTKRASPSVLPITDHKRRKTTPPSKTATATSNQNLIVPQRERTDPPAMTNTQCLVRPGGTQLAFCFSGVLSDALSRTDAQDWVKSLGGRVTTAVSSKTDYLIVGELLEDGRPYQEGSKYKKAKEHNVQVVLGEGLFYGLLHDYHERANAAPKNPYAATASNKVTKNPYASKTAAASNPYARAKPVPSVTSSSMVPKTAVSSKSSSSKLWVDQYKPSSPSEILGNADAVRKLTQWLARWEGLFQKNNTSKKSFAAPQGPWKAALLSGPPGIGKTTTATLVAKAAGRDVLEFNASDVRSKKALTEGLGDITGSQTIDFSGSKSSKKRCIIMDEVDGMGAGDRSGMTELIQMIKRSKHPVICICNDRQSQKLKSLIPYCMDLRYRRPTKSVIATRAMQVAQQEGLSVERNAAEALAESCGNDVRQVLNCLQMWASKANNLSYKDLKERERAVNKDDILRVSLFDAAKVLLQGRTGLSGATPEDERKSLYQRHDAFFVDYSFTGLIVQQNYPKVMQHPFNEAKRKGTSAATEDVLERLDAAAASLSDYAVCEHQLRGNMNWSLLPVCASMVVKTGFHAGGPNGGLMPGFPEFTTYLGRNSTKGKKARLLSEIQHHLNYRVSGGSVAARLNYMPVFRQHLLRHLRNDDTDQAIQFMDAYGLDRDDVFEKLDEFVIGSQQPPKKGFQDLSTKQKSAFTRAYNALSHTSQALVAEQGNTKKPKRRAGGMSLAASKDPDAIDEDGDDDESVDNDQEELDAEKIKTLFQSRKKATKKKTTTTTKKKTTKRKKK